MASNYTENYGLCQWEATDQVLRTDFNEDNAKIDAALKGLSDRDEELENALADMGKIRNCQVYTTSYTGNGEKSRSFSFPARPMLVNIMGMSHWMCAIQGASIASGQYLSDYGGQCLSAQWSGNNMTITSANLDSSYMCNYSGKRYTLVALLEV